jgi:hypothetical protein
MFLLCMLRISFNESGIISIKLFKGTTEMWGINDTIFRFNSPRL